MSRWNLELSEEAVDYMRGTWGFDSVSEVDDLSAFWELGEHEYVAYLLVSAGAVEANCEQAKEMIKVADSLTSKLKDKISKRLDTEGYEVLVCSSCNHHHFVPPYCDRDDWLNGNCDGCALKGFVTTSDEYYGRVKK